MTFWTKLLFLTFFWPFNIPSDSPIEKKINELFFNLPTNADMFNLRKELQKDDRFSDIEEYHDQTSGSCLHADFKENIFLKVPNKYSRLYFYYNYKGDVISYRSIFIDYKSSDIVNCDNQINELIALFKPLCYYWQKDDVLKNGIKCGESYSFCSDEESCKENEPFEPILFISYKFEGWTSGDLYVIEITNYEKEWYK